jgi:hypothetical protein
MVLFKYLLNFVKKNDINRIKSFAELNVINIVRDECNSSLLHHAEDKEIILYLSKRISINNLNDYLIPSNYIILKNNILDSTNDIKSIIKLLFYIGADFNFKNLYNNESLLDLVIKNKLDNSVIELVKKYKDIQEDAFNNSGYVNYYYKLMVWINLSIIYVNHPNDEYFFYFKINPSISKNLKLNYELLSLVNYNWNSFILNYLDKKENDLCLYCGKVQKLYKCLKCKKVYYCSYKCQKDSYYLHKNYCLKSN